MKSLDSIITSLAKTEHGFKHIVAAGNELIADKSNDPLAIAKELLKSDIYQARMLATHLLGTLSTTNNQALKILKTKVAEDDNWRVQEMLAKAIDHYCKTIGYANAMDEIEEWLNAPKHNINRAIVEGLRVWTSRPYFKDAPALAVRLISGLVGSDSEYVRKSVGNALRDISKKHPDVVKRAVNQWHAEDPRVIFVKKLTYK